MVNISLMGMKAWIYISELMVGGAFGGPYRSPVCGFPLLHSFYVVDAMLYGSQHVGDYVT